MVSEQYPPTRPEPAQPWPQPANPADATPTVQFPLYPQQPDFTPPTMPAPPRPGPYGYPTGYDAQAWQAPQPAQPGYQPYPPPPQYDPRFGGYVQPRPGGQLQPVVYQTVVQAPVVGPKSVGAAYVLWFFLGALGVHHFYLGRNGQGLTYLLLTVVLGWIGIGLVIVGIALLVDLFLIPTYTRDANYRLTGFRY